MIIYKDIENNFIELFNPENGVIIRGNVLDSSDIEPIQRDFPELVDIGIMGNCHIAKLNICKKSGVDCYQNASSNIRANMTVQNYIKIIEQCKSKVFQVALGGSGDPNKHEHFEELLKITRNFGIIPNLTTSGINIQDCEIEFIKRYCGAVAVSFYTRLKTQCNGFFEACPETINAINRLVEANCTVNIHYVISTDSIKEAIFRLENNLFPRGINAIVFILYKPVGLGNSRKVLTFDNVNFIKLLNVVQYNKFDFEIGFDTCCTPALIKWCSNISINSLDFCEASRFSMYIDCDLNVYPCSFDCEKGNYIVSATQRTLVEVWHSESFEKFRARQQYSCVNCIDKNICLGGCALDLNINLCGYKDL